MHPYLAASLANTVTRDRIATAKRHNAADRAKHSGGGRSRDAAATG